MIEVYISPLPVQAQSIIIKWAKKLHSSNPNLSIRASQLKKLRVQEKGKTLLREGVNLKTKSYRVGRGLPHKFLPVPGKVILVSPVYLPGPHFWLLWGSMGDTLYDFDSQNGFYYPKILAPIEQDWCEKRQF